MSSHGCYVFWSIDTAVTGKTGISASSMTTSPCMIADSSNYD